MPFFSIRNYYKNNSFQTSVNQMIMFYKQIILNNIKNKSDVG